MKYFFPNERAECFGSSLANLLAFGFGDWQTATSVFYKAREHPLNIGGVGATIIGSWPYLVSDLTSKRYNAKMLIKGITPVDLLDSTKGFGTDSVEKMCFKQAVLYGVNRKLFTTDPSNFFNGSEILSVILNAGTSRESGHAMVSLGTDSRGYPWYIDNGICGPGYLSKTTGINGVLSVRKNKQALGGI